MYKKQIVKLYLVAIFESFSLGNASWVALLALRGYSIAQIGILESIFHVVSLCGEIPSGVMADVLGRKRVMVLSRVMSLLSALAMIFSQSFVVSLCGEIPSGVMADVLGRKRVMVLSRVMSLLSALAMIFSQSFWSIAAAVGINALSYNLASGTREALAYESLKRYGKESEYNRFSATEMMIYRIAAVGINALSYNLASGTREALAYESLKRYGKESEYNRFSATEMMIYRIGTACSTLLAGLSLSLGYKKAYSADVVLKGLQR